MKRRRAREYALQILFQIDFKDKKVNNKDLKISGQINKKMKMLRSSLKILLREP